MNSTIQISLKLVSRSIEAEGICSLEFQSADGKDLPEFEAGAHVDLALPNGLTRPYSLCNDPAERHRYVFGVQREVNSRGGSKAVHDNLAVGDIVMAGRPRNLFPLIGGASHSILLAGGIGVTPLLAMAETLLRERASFEFHYATRSLARCAFMDRLSAPLLADRVRLYHDDSQDDGAKFDAGKILGVGRAGVHAYVCGPSGFIENVIATAKSIGWCADQIHSESFSPAATSESENRPFDIVLAKSGQVLHVPSDRSAISVLEEYGVAPPVSCEQGICGTCITTVLEGQPEHRDQYLTENDKERGDCFTPCCSRAKSERLVLDL